MSVRTLSDVKKSRFKKLWFDFVSGKKYINKLEPDVVFSLQNIITFGVKSPQAVYIHQSIPFQDVKSFSLLKKKERALAVIQKFIGLIIKKSAKKADKVIVQTEWMKDAILRRTKISEQNVIVAMPKVSAFSPDVGKFDKKRFFYPTTNEIYKNIDCIIGACNILNEEGINDFTVRLTLPKGKIIHPNIECVGLLEKAEIENEYQSGTLLFPSYIETVGLPLLEAVSCNTVIIASDTLFSKECLKDYDNYELFNPFNCYDLAEKMKRVYYGKIFPKQTFSERKKLSSWDEVYNTIINL